MPLGIHKLNIRKWNHYISTTSVLLFIYEQIILNKTMLYNVVFWQSSALTDKILKSNSKLSACKFWSVSVKSLSISRRIYWITVWKIESRLKVSVRTTENTTITHTSGFWERFFLLLGMFIFCLCICWVWVVLFWLFGWFVGFLSLNTKGCLLISLWSCKKCICRLFYHFLTIALKCTISAFWNSVYHSL